MIRMTRPCALQSCRPPAGRHRKSGNQYHRPPVRSNVRRIIYSHRLRAMPALRPSSWVRASTCRSVRVYAKRASQSKAETPHRACSRRCQVIYSPQSPCRSRVSPTRRSHLSALRPSSEECAPHPLERCSAHTMSAASPTLRNRCHT